MIASTEGVVEITAAKSIRFDVGGTYYLLTPDRVESGTKGAWQVYAGGARMAGPKVSRMPMPSFGKGYSGYYVLKWQDERIGPYQRYRITRPDGSVLTGRANGKGETGMENDAKQ